MGYVKLGLQSKYFRVMQKHFITSNSQFYRILISINTATDEQF